MSDLPWVAAVREIDPEFTPSATTTAALERFYQGMAILAAGVQAAGPKLTPSSFERGLFGLKFANVGSGASPL